jgi:SAM-dependent methyltransferase
MLKMYHRLSHGAAGSSPEFWEDNWKTFSFDNALRRCPEDPLHVLFDRYAKPPCRFLEGGCGRGQWVAYLHSRGVDVVGLDFAAEALTDLRRRYPEIEVHTGDVAALPFPDGTFDVYYSGGVVEHFEAGPEKALSEARRVLRPNGVLLITVPYESPLRWFRSFFTKDWKSVRSMTADGEPDPPGVRFFQYAYTRREFTRLLERAGFRVLNTQGMSILWGLRELPLVNSYLERRGRSAAAPPPPAEPSGVNGDTHAPHHPPAKPSLLKRVLVREDDTIPVAGWSVRFLRWVCANMMMYVCVPAPTARGRHSVAAGSTGRHAQAARSLSGEWSSRSL